MSKNEITPGEKDTIRRSSEPTVITTASGTAEPEVKSTVYGDDLDNDAGGRFTISAISGVNCAKQWAPLMNGKRDRPIIG